MSNYIEVELVLIEKVWEKLPFFRMQGTENNIFVRA